MDTPASLLERLRRPADTTAWPRFVELYAPLLHYWARRTGLQEADAAGPGFVRPNKTRQFHDEQPSVFIKSHRDRRAHH